MSSLIFVFSKQLFKYLIVTHFKPTLCINILEYHRELCTGRFFFNCFFGGQEPGFVALLRFGGLLSLPCQQKAVLGRAAWSLLFSLLQTQFVDILKDITIMNYSKKRVHPNHRKGSKSEVF